MPGLFLPAHIPAGLLSCATSDDPAGTFPGSLSRALPEPCHVAPWQRARPASQPAYPPASPQTLLGLSSPSTCLFLPPSLPIHDPFCLFLALLTPQWVLRPRGSRAGSSGLLQTFRVPLPPPPQGTTWETQPLRSVCPLPPALQRVCMCIETVSRWKGPHLWSQREGTGLSGRYCPVGHGKLPAEEAGPLVPNMAVLLSLHGGGGRGTSRKDRAWFRFHPALPGGHTQRPARRGQHPRVKGEAAGSAAVAALAAPAS